MVLGTTILSNGKGHFGPTDRDNRTTHSGPPSKLVPNILVGPNRNGWCTNRNFRNFGLNGRRPLTLRIAKEEVYAMVFVQLHSLHRRAKVRITAWRQIYCNHACLIQESSKNTFSRGRYSKYEQSESIGYPSLYITFFPPFKNLIYGQEPIQSNF